MLELSPLVQRVLTYTIVGLAVLWLIRHVRRMSRQGGCANCPQAPQSTPTKDRVSLPIIPSSK